MTPGKEAARQQGLVLGLGQILLLAIWFGLVTGWTEVLIQGGRKLLFGEVLRLSRDFPWMTPLANLLLFTALGMGLACLAVLRPRLATFRNVAAVLAFAGCLALLLLSVRVHSIALLLLAAGFAIQISRLLSRHPEAILRRARGSAAIMLLAVAVAGAALTGWQQLRERRAEAALPAAPPGAPNVLLIVLDTVRAPSMSLYGYARATTPHLSRIAEAGVRFDWAIATAPWTLPSHGSLFTGRWP
ncbi:MAG: sulfatase-like hydrolase/transferase, partial [Gemmatimonadota bacterium]